MGYVLIIGGNSDIGKALAEKYAIEGYNIYLAGLNIEELEQTKNHLTETYEIEVEAMKFSVLEFYTHRNFYNGLPNKPEAVLFAVDYAGDQEKAKKDFLETKNIIDTNFTGLASIMNIVANNFEARNEGFIAGISSIIPDENKKEFYAYGSAKRAFCTYLEGLKTRFKKTEVSVYIAKPSFTYSGTASESTITGKYAVQPEEAAKSIFNAHKKELSKDEDSENIIGKIKGIFKR